MIKKKPQHIGTIEIDLTGPAGNVFSLIGCAKQLARKLDLDGEAIQADMMSSDYEHAIEVFDAHFGNFVTLYR